MRKQYDMASISIVIPTYNSESTIEKCLKSIFQSAFRGFEVVISDDGSTDKTIEIAGRFNCQLIVNKTHVGRSNARNLGVEHSKGEIIVFIDSDVLIKDDTLEKIYDLFDKNKDIDAITGMLSKENPNKDFFSQYKNLYMNFVFNNVQNPIDFLYGSIFAMRKNVFEPFSEKFGKADDTDLGKRLAKKGCKIILDKSLEVVHLKKYNFFTFVINDFEIPYSWALQFLNYCGHNDMLKKGKFAHASFRQIISLLMIPFLLLFLLFIAVSKYFIIISLLLVLLFLLLHFEFLAFIKKERGGLFCFKAVPIIFIDALAMDAGIFAGFIDYFLRKRPK